MSERLDMETLTAAAIEDLARRSLLAAGASPAAAGSLAGAIAAAGGEGMATDGLAYPPV